MSTPDERPRPDGDPVPPAWDAPPQAPAWDRPAEQSGWSATPPGQSGWSAAPPPAQGWGPPPGYGAPPQPGYGGAYGGPAQMEAKAIVALVLAIGSFVVFPFLPAIAALFVASAARRDIDASGGRLTGGGLVTAAKVVSWINIALCVVGVLFAVLAFGVLFSV